DHSFDQAGIDALFLGDLVDDPVETRRRFNPDRGNGWWWRRNVRFGGDRRRMRNLVRLDARNEGGIHCHLAAAGHLHDNRVAIGAMRLDRHVPSVIEEDDFGPCRHDRQGEHRRENQEPPRRHRGSTYAWNTRMPSSRGSLLAPLVTVIGTNVGSTE